MHVVEHDQQRPFMRQPGQEAARRPGRFFRPPRLDSQADGGGEPRRAARRRLRVEAFADPVLEIVVGEPGQKLAERRIRWTPRAAGAATAER